MSKEQKLVVIVHESVVVSLIKDFGTFLLFAGLLYFNHKYLDGNVLIDLLFIIVVIMALLGRVSTLVFAGNKKDAIKWLENK